MNENIILAMCNSTWNEHYFQLTRFRLEKVNFYMIFYAGAIPIKVGSKHNNNTGS